MRQRRSLLLGLDSPQKLDIVQVQAQEAPSQHDQIHKAIMDMVNQQPRAEREAHNLIDKIGGERALELLKAGSSNGDDAVGVLSDSGR